MINIPNKSKILSFISLESIINLKRSNTGFDETLKYYPMDLWKRFCSYESMIVAAKENFVEFFEYILEYEFEFIPVLKVMAVALNYQSDEFWLELCRIYKVPDKIIMFFATRYGRLDIIKKFIAKDKTLVNICFEPISDKTLDHNISMGEILEIYSAEYLGSKNKKDFAENFDIMNDSFLHYIFYGTGSSALHATTWSGDLETVKFLVDNNAWDHERDEEDEYTYNTVLAASFYNHRHIVRYLIEKGFRYFENPTVGCSIEGTEYLTRLISGDCNPYPYDEITEDDFETYQFFERLIKNGRVEEAIQMITNYGNTMFYPLIENGPFDYLEFRNRRPELGKYLKFDPHLQFK